MPSKSRAFSLEEQLFYLTISIVLMIGSAYLSLQQSSQTANREQSQFSDLLLKHIYEDIGTVNGVMTSLPTLLQVSSDTGEDDLDVFSQTAIDATNTIKSIGRFERVSIENKSQLKKQMLEQGIYSFSIKDLIADGTQQTATTRPFHYPLVRLQPFNPLSARMIGVDLAADSKLSTAIETAIKTNSSVLVNYPAGWKNASDMLMIHPTYLGRYVPDTEALRIEQSRGGFMFEINISGILDRHKEITSDINILISLKKDSTKNSGNNASLTLLHKTIFSERKKRYFPNLFTGVQKTASPSIGNNTLYVEINSAPGVTANALSRAGLVMLLVWSVMIIACVVVRRGKIINMIHQQTQRELQNERETALVTLKAIADAVVTIDENGSISYANPATERLLKTASSDLVGKDISSAIRFELSVVNNEDKSEKYSLKKALGRNRPFEFPELNVLDSLGTAIEIESSLSPLGDSENNQGAVLAMRDVSSERQLLKELEYLATHDSLTKIANRYLFDRYLQDLIKSSVERGTEHALCFIDLDKFKIVNDTCGHPAGDKLLLQVTRGIQSIISENDTLARLGGDEFGLLIRNCSEHESEILAQRVHEFFSASYFQEDDNIFPVRASIGYAHIDGSFATVDSVMKAADMACYLAKDNGRNKIHKYKPDETVTENADTKSELMPKLISALEDERFCLTVQPIVPLKSHTKHSNHYEILLRYKQEDGRLTSPSQLLSAAKRYEKIYEIEQWVISTAFSLIKQYEIVTGDCSLIFSINLSTHSSADGELFDYIENQLHKHNLNAGNICFEVNEADAIEDIQSLKKLFKQLQNIGFKVALDNFGAGINSFGMLATLPLNYLKIDGNIISAIDTNMIYQEIVRCTNTVAQHLDISLIAVNVENQKVVESLISLDIQNAQGFHFGEPFPLVNLLVNRSEFSSKAA